MPKRKHLIIGCGGAALSALKQIRKSGSDDEVKLVTMEDYLPYAPMSLPYLISGTKKEEEIFITEKGFFDKMNATFARGKRVDRIEPDRNTVFYADGESETYDTLLITTGSKPRLQSELTAAKIPGFHIMDDYVGLKEIKDNSRVTILGVGFVGTELAVSLVEKGHMVHLIAPRDRILRPYFDAELDDIIIDLFSEKGIPIELNWGEVAAIERHDPSIEVTFESGQKITTDVLIPATGVTPRISFLKESGLRINEGLVVDRTMKTSRDNIFAAGDVAEAPGFYNGNKGLSLTWPSAVEQGRIAGSNMVGVVAAYDGWLPMNAFNFFGHFALSIGEYIASEKDEALIDKDKENRRFGKIVCHANKLIGANFFNVDVDGGALQYLIRNRIDVGAHRQQLLSNPKEIGRWLMHESEKKNTLSLEHQEIKK
jgi:phenylglyoxylate dehydrogenase epsilon subunit